MVGAVRKAQAHGRERAEPAERVTWPAAREAQAAAEQRWAMLDRCQAIRLARAAAAVVAQQRIPIKQMAALAGTASRPPAALELLEQQPAETVPHRRGAGLALVGLLDQTQATRPAERVVPATISTLSQAVAEAEAEAAPETQPQLRATAAQAAMALPASPASSAFEESEWRHRTTHQ